MRSTRAGMPSFALEVDDAVVLLGTTTDVTHGDAAMVVDHPSGSATRPGQRAGTLVQVGVTTRTAERRPGKWA